MKIVICPDSFKGSLSAEEVSNAIASTLLDIFPDAELIELPLADGGEGTSDILKKKFPKEIKTFAKNPLGKRISVTYQVDEEGKKAFIESARIIGLPLLSCKERNPMKTSSYGLGEIINEAIEMGCKEITVSLGGSSTCDGGIGMANALGFRFKDTKGDELECTGENLSKISMIIEPKKSKDWNIHVITDVDNPLYGENGASYVYSPQKGASPDEVKELDKGLINFASQCMFKGLCNSDRAYERGMGAAGGLGFGLSVLMNGKVSKGIDYIFKSVKFSEVIDDAGLIITGEGKLDRQSLMGKVLSGVLALAHTKDIPVIAIGGIVEDQLTLLSSGVKAVYSISDPSLSIEENMKKDIAIQNIKRSIMEIFSS